MAPTAVHTRLVIRGSRDVTIEDVEVREVVAHA